MVLPLENRVRTPACKVQFVRTESFFLWLIKNYAFVLKVAVAWLAAPVCLQTFCATKRNGFCAWNLLKNRRLTTLLALWVLVRAFSLHTGWFLPIGCNRNCLSGRSGIFRLASVVLTWFCQVFVSSFFLAATVVSFGTERQLGPWRPG